MARQKRAMKRSFRRQQIPPPVRHTLAKQSAAVLALGLGLTAAGPAEASVVYTPIDQTITNDSLNFLFHSDLFQFNANHYSFSPYAGAGVGGTYSGSVLVNYSGWYAALLNFGTPIDASGYFNWYGKLALSYHGLPYGGEWAGQKGYLGLQFTGDDGTHYGWAKLEVPTDVSFLKLFGFAYETEVDTEILAGAGDPNPVPLPGSLALLASGAAGLLAYRRLRRS